MHVASLARRHDSDCSAIESGCSVHNDSLIENSYHDDDDAGDASNTDSDEDG